MDIYVDIFICFTRVYRDINIYQQKLLRVPMLLNINLSIAAKMQDVLAGQCRPQWL